MLQVIKDLLDHYRVFNAGDDFHGAAAGPLQVSMSILKTRLSRCAQEEELPLGQHTTAPGRIYFQKRYELQISEAMFSLMFIVIHRPVINFS